jgi:hypothetical protein
MRRCRMERRKTDRLKLDSMISITTSGELLTGALRNISEDGAMIKLNDGARFSPEAVGARIELAAEGAIPWLQSFATLVLIFDVWQDQYIAVSFLDTIGQGPLAP